MNCPCGNSTDFNRCCEPYLTGKALAPTPEALMRSRYTAYVKGEIPYLKHTLTPDTQSDFDEKEAREWAKNSEWLGLEITSAQGNQVEFTAKYKLQGKTLEHHEVSTFKKIKDRWYYEDGEAHMHEEGEGHHAHHEKQAPIVREGEKIGRNDVCACGSGKKHKKCCGK